MIKKFYFCIKKINEFYLIGEIDWFEVFSCSLETDYKRIA
jgi:hypothetical protein